MKKRMMRLWVDPDYAKAIKIKAASKNMRIVDFTKSEAPNLLMDIELDNKKKRRIYDDLSEFYKL